VCRYYETLDVPSVCVVALGMAVRRLSERISRWLGAMHSYDPARPVWRDAVLSGSDRRVPELGHTLRLSGVVAMMFAWRVGLSTDFVLFRRGAGC